VDFCEEHYYKGKKIVPSFVAVTGPGGVALAVARPSVVAELFLTKNKYFDKHPITAKQMQRMTGESILFEPSNLRWQMKRKALSSALYKDKLKDMIELMKQVTI
jgi:cytochrome P450